MQRIPQESSHPPLENLILHFWLYFGNSDWWIRLLYVLVGIGTCFAVYLTGREYIDKSFGLASMLLFAVSPISIWASQYVRAYIYGALFTGLSLYFLVKIFFKKNSWKSWCGYAIFGLLSIYSFYLSILFLIAENLFFLFNPTWQHSS